MNQTPATDLKCTVCGQTIESCACCDERDWPPPICDRCVTEALMKSVRTHYVGLGVSMSAEAGQLPQ
jgi:hypothetical protein